MHTHRQQAGHVCEHERAANGCYLFFIRGFLGDVAFCVQIRPKVSAEERKLEVCVWMARRHQGRCQRRAREFTLQRQNTGPAVARKRRDFCEQPRCSTFVSAAPHWQGLRRTHHLWPIFGFPT